ncbi:DUF3500 domain-containing protein [Flavobacteriaceae bacterium XHP0103]|uniref:DUF3500 domain-containing protein n=1 Tax=Marixanthotalea marina TaxID=2844359 RepID=UPI002989C3DA|nr:DUF3500 domain-containing protein [Marixanthotalea marina]MBU3823063.1 DUF3500 domain-containing protein [Marixanthotalea marina]
MFKNLVLILIPIIIGISSCKTKQSNKSADQETEFKTDFEVDENSFMMKMQSNALQEPYKGIFTSSNDEHNLFPIKSTGVSTKPIINAAVKFIKSLSNRQAEKTVFQIEDDEWRKWSNVDNGIYERQGISLKEMNKNQRTLAFKLMQEALSAKGLQLSKDIMKTDQTLREINNNNPMFDEDLYYFTIMGTPSAIEPWGWQIDGHHLVINYFVLGDQVVMTPTFMGGEPIITETGKYKGNTLFQDEQNLGLKFINSLSLEQQKEAIINSEKNNNNIKAEAFKDNITLDYEGIKGDKLTDEQKTSLLHLINQYISNMREGHATVKMEEVENHFKETYFSWVGELDEDAVFYYRIHSPVVLIEFDHQRPVGVRGNGREVSRNHIHTVVRTPNGNDYGKDLLKQHLESHHH